MITAINSNQIQEGTFRKIKTHLFWVCFFELIDINISGNSVAILKTIAIKVKNWPDILIFLKNISNFFQKHLRLRITNINLWVFIVFATYL